MGWYKLASFTLDWVNGYLVYRMCFLGCIEHIFYYILYEYLF